MICEDSQGQWNAKSDDLMKNIKALSAQLGNSMATFQEVDKLIGTLSSELGRTTAAILECSEHAPQEINNLQIAIRGGNVVCALPGARSKRDDDRSQTANGLRL